MALLCVLLTDAREEVGFRDVQGLEIYNRLMYLGLEFMKDALQKKLEKQLYWYDDIIFEEEEEGYIF